ncbi:homoserine dehydrogenase [Halovenus aranensis]|uniref:homoserine dehydrogenase n=1 Tax=Halovenus aranensis TaxID=890420 RepID=A0A1G8XG92_9EURY|nr:homoserine dehydrogenase [Halovenus aranensis]SDJ89456.1 homoserine dehydrogenase [Halovenus aranensis]
MRIAVVGAGAVGQAVVELAEPYGHTVTAVADSSAGVVDADGLDAEAVLDRKRTEGTVGPQTLDAVLDSEYDALVEATPTTVGDAQPAFEHVRTALGRDRDVVLANKGPVAQRYDDVRGMERDSDGAVRFEATVGGAIPVFSTIEDIGAENVTAVRGVLNGTANFILSRMTAEGVAYEHALAEAQDIGVAEADPTFDVDGTDAALKCAILANVLTDTTYTLDAVEMMGIRDIPASALELAQQGGSTIRLIGEVDESGVRVRPRLVDEHGTLAVSGTQNIVQVETTHAGRVNISGRGAGGHETATAIMSDLRQLEY